MTRPYTRYYFTILLGAFAAWMLAGCSSTRALKERSIREVLCLEQQVSSNGTLDPEEINQRVQALKQRCDSMISAGAKMRSVATVYTYLIEVEYLMQLSVKPDTARCSLITMELPVYHPDVSDSVSPTALGSPEYIHAVRTLRTLVEMGHSTISQLNEHFSILLKAKQQELKTRCLLDYQQEQEVTLRDWIRQQTNVHKAALQVYRQYPAVYAQVHRSVCQ